MMLKGVQVRVCMCVDDVEGCEVSCVCVCVCVCVWMMLKGVFHVNTFVHTWALWTLSGWTNNVP